MSKGNSQFVTKLTLTLLVICAVCVGLVAYAHNATKGVIAERAAADVKAAYKQVFPELGELTKEKAPTGTLITDIQCSKKDGKANGYIYTVDPTGYGGKVTIMLGITMDSKLTGIKILSLSETPGLGMKSTEPAWQKQFQGKPLKEALVVTKQEPSKDNDVKAITAATITSRAVVSGINAARDHFMKTYANGKG